MCVAVWLCGCVCVCVCVCVSAWCVQLGVCSLVCAAGGGAMQARQPLAASWWQLLCLGQVWCQEFLRDQVAVVPSHTVHVAMTAAPYAPQSWAAWRAGPT